ncbi:hypothetical protein [Ornithinimicrobium kibberense]|uniref:hypothetical protein n=1 Tax=Ornithinimicrobium kibberense TaxID=282060 RepID=UPI003606DBE3
MSRLTYGQPCTKSAQGSPSPHASTQVWGCGGYPCRVSSCEILRRAGICSCSCSTQRP